MNPEVASGFLLPFAGLRCPARGNLDGPSALRTSLQLSRSRRLSTEHAKGDPLSRRVSKHEAEIGPILCACFVHVVFCCLVNI